MNLLQVIRRNAFNPPKKNKFNCQRHVEIQHKILTFNRIGLEIKTEKIHLFPILFLCV